MENEISATVAKSNPQYEGLDLPSSPRFLAFLKGRNASETTVDAFLWFRLTGQIALSDGLIFDESQILFRNESFDADRISNFIVIGCRQNYDLILLDVQTSAIFVADRWYEVREDALNAPVKIADSIGRFLRKEAKCIKGCSENYLVPKVFDTNLQRVIDAICAAGHGTYSKPTKQFLKWLEGKSLSAEAKRLFSWFMPTSEIMVGTGSIYPVHDMMSMNEHWRGMSKCGFLILGSCLNGDFIVLNMKSDVLEIGYIEDVLGTQEGDLIRKIPGVASITPSRRVRRASWTLTGSGTCCE